MTSSTHILTLGNYTLPHEMTTNLIGSLMQTHKAAIEIKLQKHATLNSHIRGAMHVMQMIPLYFG
jgi:hypothetical protein